MTLDWANLTNLTNSTVQSQVYVTQASAGVDPTIVYLASAAVLIFCYCGLFWVMNRRNHINDWFLGVLMLITGLLMTGDPLLSGVKLLVGGTAITLPLIAILLALFETVGLVVFDDSESGNMMEKT